MVAIVYRIHDYGRSATLVEPHSIEGAKADPHALWCGGCRQQWRGLPDVDGVPRGLSYKTVKVTLEPCITTLSVNPHIQYIFCNDSCNVDFRRVGECNTTELPAVLADAGREEPLLVCKLPRLHLVEEIPHRWRSKVFKVLFVFVCHSYLQVSKLAIELVRIAVKVPTLIRKHDYQDHSSRLFQFSPAVSRKLSQVICADSFTRRVSVASNSPPENNS
jgi:hypothetical protein